MQFNPEEVIILEISELTSEERVGARYIINQLLDIVDCKMCVLSYDQNKMVVENYGLTDKEDLIFMKYLQKRIEELGTESEGVHS